MYENIDTNEDDTLNFSTKYRPRSLKTFIAPSTTKTLLESMVDKNRFPKVMLITGRTSAGKTSLARILGHAINGLKADEVCEDYYEMNMGDAKGIEEARNLAASLKYKPLKFTKKVIVLDECFIAGTKINTPKGIKNIEDIKTGDEVYNLNGIGKVTHTFCKESKDLYEVTVKRHNKYEKIICTSGHPFYTEKGWTKAKDLAYGTKLFSLQEVCSVWEEDIPTQRNRKQSRKVGGISQKESLLSKMSRCFILRKNEDKKSVKRQEKYTKNIRNKKEEWNDVQYSSRGEWEKDSETSKEIEKDFRRRLQNRIRGKNRILRCWEKLLQKCKTLPYQLQDRFSKSKKENCHRSRRLESYNEKSYKRGQEERQTFEEIRVESVKNLESTSGRYVYNLEVSGHPSYYVEGILVHNCHCITAAAASALLKPLEEPPAHVVFILCTDNPEKLLPTIRNRCTQIQLETPTPDLLVPMLKRVCKKENIKLDDDVLLEIADSADGQPRQALQTLQNIAGMIEGIKDKKQLKKIIEDAKVTILKNDEDREAIMFLLSLYSKNGPVCMTTVSNAGDYTAFINKALNYNRFIFDQMLYNFKKEKVKGYYWTPNRQKFFDQAVKKCSEWQTEAVKIHSLLVDIRQQMGTYTVGEYHLVMSKCLTYINSDDEDNE